MEKYILFCLCCLFLTFTLADNSIGQSDRSEEIATLITDFNSTNITQRITAAKVVTRSGFQSPELYATIEKLLKKGYNSSKDSKHIDEMSWLCKALAASGDVKYSAMLNEISAKANSSKLQKYARTSSAQIGQYAKRQEVINTTAFWDSNLSDDENRYINMLKSGDSSISRDAAKQIYRSTNLNKAVYDVVEDRIHHMLSHANTSYLETDTLAWLCKALSTSGDKKYATTLEKVISFTSNTKNTSLQSHARKALNRL